MSMSIMEKRALNVIADRIEELASLETCGVNEKSKNDMKIYMTWFDSCVKDLREIIEVSDLKGWDKKWKIEQIVRYY